MRALHHPSPRAIVCLLAEGLRLLATRTEMSGKAKLDVGYEDVNSFQRLFKRQTGLSMVDYRRKFAVRQSVNAERQAESTFRVAAMRRDDDMASVGA